MKYVGYVIILLLAVILGALVGGGSTVVERWWSDPERVAQREAKAAMREAEAAAEEQDFATAVRKLGPLAEEGDAEAQAMLGRLLAACSQASAYEKSLQASRGLGYTVPDMGVVGDLADDLVEACEGVRPDYAQGLMWLYLGLAQEGGPAAKRIASFLSGVRKNSEFYPPEFMKVRRGMRAWLRRHPDVLERVDEDVKRELGLAS